MMLALPGVYFSISPLLEAQMLPIFLPALEAQSLTKALLETSLYVRLCLSVEQNKNCCTDTWMCEEVAKWFENGV